MNFGLCHLVLMGGFNATLPEQIRGVGTFVSRKICARSNITLAVKSFYPQPIPAALNHCTYIEGGNILTFLVKIQQDKFYKPYQTIKTGSRFLSNLFLAASVLIPRMIEVTYLSLLGVWDLRSRFVFERRKTFSDQKRLFSSLDYISPLPRCPRTPSVDWEWRSRR